MEGEIDMEYTRENKRSNFFKVVKSIFEILSYICAVTGVSVFGGKDIMSIKLQGTFTDQENNVIFYIVNVLIDYVLNNWSMILLLTFLTMLIVKGLCTPLYKIFKNGIPPQETKPSYIEIGVLCFLIGCLFCYHMLVDVAKAQISAIIIEGEDIPVPQIDEGNVSESQIGEVEQPFLTDREKIEIFIIRSNTEIIPINELKDLTDDELYYIRNGIFAYSGQWFLSCYYDKYSWYDSKYSSTEVWNHMNSYQMQNIENIGSIEEQRESGN